jgi:hypothetical protein
MGGNARNWASAELRKRRSDGLVEDSRGPTAKAALRELFKHDGDRSLRLRLYLEHSPSGERDVEPILNRLAAERKGSEEWLRAVLDADDD